VIRHVLDTSAILAHYLQEPGSVEVNELLSDGPGEVGLSLITLVELRGRLTQLTADLQEVDRVFKLYSETLTTRLPFAPQTMEIAIELRVAVRPRLPLVDSLIAASAKEYEAILVHRDPHMAAIPVSLVKQVVLPPKK
jgi:predicted nucleic acid-binding protein